MLGLSQIEIWLYGGIFIMLFAVLFGSISIIVFRITGKKLKKKLEAEYGKPFRHS